MSRHIFGIICAAICSVAACVPSQPPPPATPTWQDASDAAPYQAGDGSLTESTCARACDLLTRVCGLQGPACVYSYTFISQNQRVGKPDGGALSCGDILTAQSAQDVRALGISCKGTTSP